MKLLLPILLTSLALAQTWINHPSGTTASLRGVSVVSPMVSWASGSGGTYLATTDGGANWRVAKVPGAEQLDFRGVRAMDASTAYLMSIGTGDKSRIYKTTDSGAHWALQFTNPDATGFFDAIAFWDARHGIVVGDPVDEHFVVLTTDDGGEHWSKQPTPPALPKEGAFAASNTCLTLLGHAGAWFATGGQSAARVFHSKDRGRTWTAALTPVRNDGPSAGIFSLAFSDARHGIAVGGDYNKPADQAHNIAVTSDGGRTWKEPPGPPPNGFRSAVAYLPDRRIWIAAGTSGSDLSGDNGKSWKAIDTGAYNALGFVPGAGWAAGPKGNLAQWSKPAR